jgi:hypothetical protein
VKNWQFGLKLKWNYHNIEYLENVNFLAEHWQTNRDHNIAPRSNATFTPSPPPASRLPMPPALLPFPPPPPLSRSADAFPPGLVGKELPNMFHFGDVSVSHHPDSAPVPMVIPMVYLYPLSSHEQGKPFLTRSSHYWI